MSRWPLSRLTLRQRVSLAFALGALGVSVLLAVTTYTIAAEYLWSQRQQTILRQAAFRARTVNDAATTRRPAVEALLERLDADDGQGGQPLVLLNGRWYDALYPGGHTALPTGFTEAVEAARPVMQRFETEGDMAIAVALPTTDGAYVEVFPAVELDRTLKSLGVILVGTTTATTALGLLLGRWASRRSLQPLTAVTAAAAAIAEGDLDARLDGTSDPDLTALAHAFNTTAGKLQNRMERDARFAANVSHELRSPLTIMVNAVEVLCQRAGSLDPETREVLDLLADDVHRLARMVNDLLEISRLDADAVDLHREVLPLGRFVQTIADRSAGRSVTFLDHQDDPLVAVDKRRMERIIENLVQNAETHGGGTTRVSIEADADAARMLIDDNGSGIPADLRTRIFERFARGARSDTESSGSGLGLALVAEHVRLHQGRVWAEDSPTGGARFVVELPRAPR